MEHSITAVDYPISRRSLPVLGGATFAASVRMSASSSPPFEANRIIAVTFDAFAIFDLRPLWVACESAFPGKGSTLSAAWRSRQFASAGWDAAGARWFGYPTFWDNPLSVPVEELEVAADASGSTLRIRGSDGKDVKAKSITLPSSHVPMLSHPDEVAVLIAEAPEALKAR